MPPQARSAAASTARADMSVILVTGSYDHEIRFWEAWSGICSRTIPRAAESGVRHLPACVCNTLFTPRAFSVLSTASESSCHIAGVSVLPMRPRAHRIDPSPSHLVNVS